jgi:hypothetical protein
MRDSRCAAESGTTSSFSLPIVSFRGMPDSMPGPKEVDATWILSTSCAFTFTLGREMGGSGPEEVRPLDRG